MEWFVYLLHCANDSLYCGIAKDPKARFNQHAQGKGARYTRMHKALALVCVEGPFTHGDALRRERQIKAMSRAEKSKMVTKKFAFASDPQPCLNS